MKSIIYRRKREGRTNYNKRLQLLVSRKNRIVIRKSLKSVLVQIVKYEEDGDKVLMSAHSRDLKKYGLSYSNANISVAYLTGLLCGVKAVKAGLNEGIVDLGLQTPKAGGKLMAVVKGLVDAGFDMHYNEEAFPSDDRISGQHIQNYAESAKDKFSGYAAAKIDASKIVETFEAVKAKVLADK